MPLVLGVSCRHYQIVCTFQACPHPLPGSLFFHVTCAVCRLLGAVCVHSQLQNATRAFVWTRSANPFSRTSLDQRTSKSNWSLLVVKSSWKYVRLKVITFMLCRSTGTLNRGPNAKQKISFSRKFPFMKSRERLNKLDDDESFENGSNHRWILVVLPCFKIFTPLLHPFHTLFSLLSDISEK